MRPEPGCVFSAPGTNSRCEEASFTVATAKRRPPIARSSAGCSVRSRPLTPSMGEPRRMRWDRQLHVCPFPAPNTVCSPESSGSQAPIYSGFAWVSGSPHSLSVLSVRLNLSHAVIACQSRTENGAPANSDANAECFLPPLVTPRASKQREVRYRSWVTRRTVIHLMIMHGSGPRAGA